MVLHAPTAPRVGLESILLAVAGLCCMHSSPALASQAGCHAGNGLKTGYISASAASVWSRLTLAPEANWAGTPWLKHEPPALCALSAGCAAEAQMPEVRRGAANLRSSSQATDKISPSPALTHGQC